MGVVLTKVGVHAWRATWRGFVGAGAGPLSAANDLRRRVAASRASVVA